MKTTFSFQSHCFRLLAVFGVTSGFLAAQQRPPAVPLITHNPYFSVWSMADKLTDQDTKHWTGTAQPIAGLIRIDGKPFRFMGAHPDEVPAMEQTSLQVTPTHTIYSFQASQVTLIVTFFTPALPKDLDVLSRPVTYLTFAVKGQGEHEVSLLLDVAPAIAVDTSDEAVTWGRSRAEGMTVLNVGSRDQRVLGRSGDNLRIDWGYFHLAVPDGTQAQTAAIPDAIHRFVATGTLPAADDMDMPRTPRDHAAHLAVVLPMGRLTEKPIVRHVLLSYTDGYAIEYLGRKLHPYWQRNGLSVEAMLSKAEEEYPTLEQRGQKFDSELEGDLERTGGSAYAQLATLAYRQTLAAYGFVADVDGTPLLFPKENFSNGCISTVDVIYPSSPFFLLFNPALLQAQLKPVLEYAALPRWKWPFAPHDLGVYPLANGQVYGGGEISEENQMPVEESGNLLIMADAMSREQSNWDFVRQYWPQLTLWANYLRDKGLDPANQLSTDDFAGHLAHNANLSIKAIEALAAYAQMAKALGKVEVAQQYEHAADEMATKWQSMAIDGDHYKLAFDKPNTWSQKYNLVWDRMLDLHLFSPKVSQTEVEFYRKQMNRYGLPLDSRADYTKLDWEIWTATLTNVEGAGGMDAFQAFLSPIGRWFNEGSTRVPLTDWYDTKNGKQMAFQARSVVGGIYIKALADPDLATRWRNHKN